MKYSIITAGAFRTGLQKLANVDMPIADAYRLKKLVNAIQSELENFDSLRDDILKLYAEKDKEGNPKLKDDRTKQSGYEFSQEGEKAAVDKLSDLLAMELNFGPSLLHKFTINEKVLASTPTVRFTSAELLALDDLIDVQL